jgi:deoxyribodipyrimidine photo-lyase
MSAMNMRSFVPSRAEAIARLAAFALNAGPTYAMGRNTDNGPDAHAHVSLLSPYLRYRLITEHEVVKAVLAQHGMAGAEKFIQEVLWRTYWKGWLEMRPAVWKRFLTERDIARENFPNALAITAAENGMTGIEGFDDWARELVETGYLHNHARMWFASIWIFTLRLPWALGADFFLRHLIDADAASNTLSWRWVAGLQTAGKTYLATAENIARYTNGRFSPKGLAKEAVAMTEVPIAPPSPLPAMRPYDTAKPSLLLVTHEDMNPETLILQSAAINAAYILASKEILWGEASRQFVNGAAADTEMRVKAFFGCDTQTIQALTGPKIIEAAQTVKASQIITPYAPVGPAADALKQIEPELERAGLPLIQVRRSWDTQFWPHAKKGFFPFKEHIRPGLLSERILV